MPANFHFGALILLLVQQEDYLACK